jgi:sulfopropanediol 3-dehydrogenase
MTIKYLKKANKSSSTDDQKTKEIVEKILKELVKSKEDGCKVLTKKFDSYEGDIIVSKEKIEEIKNELDQKTKDDIQFSYDRVRKFAEVQLKNYGNNFEVELSKGLFAGQTLVPVNTAGCYVPAGRYAHIASAVMSITTAKVAGVKNIIACSSPKPKTGAHPKIIYTADLCGADVILNLGGVQAIAAMAYGFFGNLPADILVGPGNQFVAEAKRILFGKVGIDLFAGPTEIAIIADKNADPEIVAVDLVGQAEHGYNSPAWLFTTNKDLAKKVMKRVPELIAELPELPKTNADAAWRDYGEVVLCNTDEEMAAISDDYAPEHLSP